MHGDHSQLVLHHAREWMDSKGIAKGRRVVLLDSWTVGRSERRESADSVLTITVFATSPEE